MKIFLPIGLTVLAGISIFVGLLFALLAVVFLAYQHRFNGWEIFLFGYSMLSPVAATAAYVFFSLYPSRFSITATTLCSLGCFAAYFLWTCEWSSGLIH